MKWALAILMAGLVGCPNDSDRPSFGEEPMTAAEIAERIGCRDPVRTDALSVGEVTDCHIGEQLVHIRIHSSSQDQRTDWEGIRNVCSEPIMQEGEKLYWLLGDLWSVNVRDNADVVHDIETAVDENETETINC
jgi:hypothetical protein